MSTDHPGTADPDPAAVAPAAEQADPDPAEAGPTRVRRRRRTRSRRKRRRRILIGAGIAVGVLVLLVGWLLYTGLRARTELEAVRSEVRTLRAEIAAGDLDGARDTARQLRSHAHKAYDLTSDPIWAATAHLPALGTPLKSVRVITSGVDRVASLVVPDLIEASGKIDPKALRRPDGSIDLAAIEAVAPSLDSADSALSAAVARITRAPSSTWLGSIDSARTDLLDQLGRLSTTLGSARTAAAVLPPMLGADGPKSYLVSFENEAELRGTGGLPGAFAILKVDNGQFSFTRFESDRALIRQETNLDFGADFDNLWHTDDVVNDYRDSNVSANFPYAAQVWAAQWERKSGQRLDGAVALDPTALSYLLKVTGPTTLPDGTRVTAHNVVALTQNTAYLRFADDNAARKRFLLDLARTVSERLIERGGDTTALVKAAAHAASEHRLLVWSRDADVEADLAGTKISGVVPDTTSPYAAIAINNAAANKLDYYLDASADLNSAVCGSTRRLTVTMRFTNRAPTGLPDSILGNVHYVGTPTKAGDNLVLVSYYATRGSEFTAVTLNGKPATASSGIEQRHPVFTVRLYLPRGEEQTVVLHLREPAQDGPLTVRPQPMVRPMDVRVHESGCG